jgi:hypothetical protein
MLELFLEVFVGFCVGGVLIVLPFYVIARYFPMWHLFSKRARLERALTRARVRHAGADLRYQAFRNALNVKSPVYSSECERLANYARDMGKAEMRVRVLRERLDALTGCDVPAKIS